MRQESNFAQEIFAVGKAMAQQFGIGAGRVLLRCIGELTEEHSNERSSPAAEAGLRFIVLVLVLRRIV